MTDLSRQAPPPLRPRRGHREAHHSKIRRHLQRGSVHGLPFAPASPAIRDDVGRIGRHRVCSHTDVGGGAIESEYLPVGKPSAAFRPTDTTIFGVENGPPGTQTFVRNGGAMTTFSPRRRTSPFQPGPPAMDRRSSALRRSRPAEASRRSSGEPATPRPRCWRRQRVIDRERRLRLQRATIVGTEELDGGRRLDSSCRTAMSPAGWISVAASPSRTAYPATERRSSARPSSRANPTRMRSSGESAMLSRRSCHCRSVEPEPIFRIAQCLRRRLDRHRVAGDTGVTTAFVWRTTTRPPRSSISAETRFKPGRGDAEWINGRRPSRIPRCGRSARLRMEKRRAERFEPPPADNIPPRRSVSADGSRRRIRVERHADSVDFDGMDVVVWDADQPPRFLKDMLAARRLDRRPDSACPFRYPATERVSSANRSCGTPTPGRRFRTSSGSFATVSDVRRTGARSVRNDPEVDRQGQTIEHPTGDQAPARGEADSSRTLPSNSTRIGWPTDPHSFVVQVDSLSPRRIPAALADEWIDDAEDIIDALSP